MLKYFKMFCFVPASGTFIKGFGKAYTIEGENLNFQPETKCNALGSISLYKHVYPHSRNDEIQEL